VRVLFRTDADSNIGTGHLMRCLALADGLRSEGAECVFLCREAGLGALAEKITAGGHGLLTLPAAAGNEDGDDLPRLAHAGWLPGGWRNDAAACRLALANQPAADWLVVDHYALDGRWERAMRAEAERVMVIDDLADRRHECEVLLDQNVLADSVGQYQGLVPEGCLLLLGPKYALLRPEFLAFGEAAPKAAGCSEDLRLLIMFGGSDPQDLTLRAVKALARIKWRGPVDVVAGSLYGKLPELAAIVSGLPQAHLHAPAHKVADLMRAAGLALGSPGVASWERCACGLPSIVLSVADNQLRLGESLGRLGAHWYLGKADQVRDDDLDAALAAWIANPLARHGMSSAAAAICDGKGVRRAVQRLAAAELDIRPATQDDSQLVYAWRNDERTRRHFFDSGPIEPATHRSWFSQTLGNADTQLLLVLGRGRVPVACVRFDYLAERARLSVYLDPDLQGYGLGVNSISLACRWLRIRRPDIRVVEADVLVDNEASRRAFSAAGFRQVWSRYEHAQ
jgi:UDP-2,4-diacetamido-2,4,6-trideoxy-beta-L-altropyranose hydrolase